MKRYIVITTGGLGNLGIQSMVYLTVGVLKQYFPDREIAVLLQYPQVSDFSTEKGYGFKVLPWTRKIRTCLLYSNTPLSSANKVQYQEYLQELRDIFEHTDFALDLSGFSLSSQWRFSVSVSYINNLRVLKKYRIRTYLLPQSFGPFDYKLFEKILIYPMIKKHLQYPEKVYVRDYDSLRHIQRFRKDNTINTLDLVLQIPTYRAHLIFADAQTAEESSRCHREIPPNAVLVVPNIKVTEYGKEVTQVYRCWIESLIGYGKKVYVFAHSTADRQLARDIKAMFPDEPGVVLVEEDFNCIQVVDFLKKFDLILAARFHAIVHSYKAGVPVLGFGWSAKYRELMTLFEQTEYLLDVRRPEDFDRVCPALERLVHNYATEAEKIKSRMESLYTGNNLMDDLAREMIALTKEDNV